MFLFLFFNSSLLLLNECPTRVDKFTLHAARTRHRLWLWTVVGFFFSYRLLHESHHHHRRVATLNTRRRTFCLFACVPASSLSKICLPISVVKQEQDAGLDDEMYRCWLTFPAHLSAISHYCILLPKYQHYRIPTQWRRFVKWTILARSHLNHSVWVNSSPRTCQTISP